MKAVRNCTMRATASEWWLMSWINRSATSSNRRSSWDSGSVMCFSGAVDMKTPLAMAPSHVEDRTKYRTKYGTKNGTKHGTPNSTDNSTDNITDNFTEDRMEVPMNGRMDKKRSPRWELAGGPC